MNLIDIPLTNQDITKILEGVKPNMKLLANIQPNTVSTIDELFGSNDHIILFIAIQEENVGHWLTILKNKKTIFWCDSMGQIPLEILDKMIERQLPVFNQTKYLLQLIEQSNYKFIVNKTKYQRDFQSVQTCGRYATLFVCLFHYQKQNNNILKLYKKVMNDMKTKYHLKTYDDVIVKLVI